MYQVTKHGALMLGIDVGVYNSDWEPDQQPFGKAPLEDQLAACHRRWLEGLFDPRYIQRFDDLATYTDCLRRICSSYGNLLEHVTDRQLYDAAVHCYVLKAERLQRLRDNQSTEPGDAVYAAANWLKEMS